YGPGWYQLEGSASAPYRWSGGSGAVLVEVPEATSVQMTGWIESLPKPNSIRGAGNGRPAGQLHRDSSAPPPVPPLTIELNQGLNTITFRSDRPPVRLPTDARALTISLTRVQLTYPDQELTCAIAT